MYSMLVVPSFCATSDLLTIFRCGHCKSMAGAWGELGTEYQDHSTVLIADVDCTQQQSVCGDHGVRGYPSLKYFKAGNKVPESYSGGRSKEALKSFIETTLV